MVSKIQENKKTWNEVYGFFVEASSLPVWGHFSVGKNLNLIGKIKSKTFLEIGCGSGRSLNYLLKRGVRKVYGLDFSEKQIEESAKYNAKYIKNGKLELITSVMEKKLKVDPI